MATANDIWSIDPTTRPFRLDPPDGSWSKSIYYGDQKIGDLRILKMVYDPCGIKSSAQVQTKFSIGDDARAKRIESEFGGWLNEWINEQLKKGLK